LPYFLETKICVDSGATIFLFVCWKNLEVVEEQNKASISADCNKFSVDRNRRWEAWAMLSLHGCILLQLAANGFHTTEENTATAHGCATGPVALTSSPFTFQRRQ